MRRGRADQSSKATVSDAFLVETARSLSSSFDVEQTVDEVMRLVVPGIADYALLYLKASDGGFHQVTSAHGDARKAPLLVELGQIHRPDLRNPDSVLGRVLCTMQPVFAQSTSPEMARAVFSNERAFAIYRELAPVSYIVVPLVANAVLLGSMVLVSSFSGRRYCTEDVARAELIGARAALAIDNARLCREVGAARSRALRSAEVESQLARARLDILRAQMDPHFLFNALNTAAMLVRRGAKGDALRAIVSLSELLRGVLATQHTLEVPLRDEMVLVEHYLEVERLRFRDRLRASVDVSSEARDASVPSLVLQPLVENAIKHGIAHDDTVCRIEVTGRVEGDRLVLGVRDDGPGFAPESDRTSHQGMGIANTRERLSRMYGRGYGLTLSNAPSGGALAVVEIPFRANDSVTFAGPNRG